MHTIPRKPLLYLTLGLSVLFAAGCSKQAASYPPITSETVGVLRYVPPGKFRRDAGFGNVSMVEQGFYMMEKEVTYPQFHAVTGLSVRNNSFNDTPVKFVNWYHALIFCNALSRKEGLDPVYTIGGSTDPAYWLTLVGGFIPTGHSADTRLSPVHANWSANGYRLPTEMEWTWAALGAKNNSRADKKAFAGSTGKNKSEDYAWFISNSKSSSHPVGTKLPNELGLFDMSGNVMEWCWDWFAEYPRGKIFSQEDCGRGAPNGHGHVLRGGSWRDDLLSLEFRSGSDPFDQDDYAGFRVIRQAVPE